jgi:carboxylesterase type B
MRARFILLFAFIPAAASASSNHTVRIETGLLAGSPTNDPSITAFKGIPFAAPPIGPNRWRPPQPPLHWQGVRDAGRFGASCPQSIAWEKKPWTHEFLVQGPVSEDCLFLNVWTPAATPAARLPVFVFFHGGSNVEGSGSVALYDGEGLARKGLVMVTINYRLGVLGFFTHPDLSKESPAHVSGNYGLLDQIAALQWVRNNIAAFGGDPARVTIAGQSAGGFDISYLILSPLAKGLFQRAILESGGVPGATDLPTLADSEKDGVKFLASKGARSIAQLRALSWRTLFSPPAFRPVLDAYVIPALERDIFAAGKQNDVPTLTGINADESRSKTTIAQYIAQAHRFANLAQQFLDFYPASTDAEAVSQSNEWLRDYSRIVQLRWAASRARTAKTPAYIYYYDHVLPGPDSQLYGAFHSAELPYVLNNLSQSDRPFTAEDRKIAETLSTYWANFAATGDPNNDTLPHWPTYRDQPKMVMEIGDKNEPLPAAAPPAKFDFISKLLGSI